PAGGVEQARRSCPRNVRLDRFDPARADADIALGAQFLARIEQLAALDDEIELVVGSHRGAYREAHRADGKGRAHPGDEAPATVHAHMRPLSDCGEFILAAPKEAACLAPESRGCSSSYLRWR